MDRWASSWQSPGYESGGLNESVPLELGAATLPALTHLELWLGDPGYGCTTTVTSLAGILRGAGLPKLKSLALKNFEERNGYLQASVEAKFGIALKPAIASSHAVVQAAALSPFFQHAPSLP